MDALLALSRGAPAATVILALIVGAGVVTLVLKPAWIEHCLFRPHWLVPRAEYATLLTSAFVHADLAHLAFNIFTFWAFAFSLERRIGTEPFVMLYFFGLLVSDAGTWWKHRREPGYRTLGASGAIMAVVFASIVYFPAASLFILPIPVPIPAPLFALGYLAFTWFASRQGGGRINHDAHLGGAIAGLVFVALHDPAAIERAWHLVAG